MEYEVTISQTNTGLQSNADATLVLVKSDEYKKYNYVVAADNYDQAVKDKKNLKRMQSIKQNVHALISKIRFWMNGHQLKIH